MNVLNIWDAEYPWDVRVEKISRALTEDGHSVRILARNRDGRPLRELLPEGEVRRMRPLGSPLRRFDAASQFPAFVNPRWLRWIFRSVRDFVPDLIVVRDLPLALPAIAAGRGSGVPVMLDMAEHYPAMIQDFHDSGRARWTDRWVRDPRAVAWVERVALAHVDHVLVVVRESADRLRRAGVAAERITVVGNTPPLSRIGPVRDAGRADGPGRTVPLKVVYLGLLERPRGIFDLVDAVSRLHDVGIPVELELIGGGMEESAVRERVRALGAGDAIRVTGPLPHGEALRRVATSDVGVVPHHGTASWRATIPNKLFDYMAAGLPVVASDVPPVRRVVEQHDCGLLVPPGSPDALARSIARLQGDPGLRHRLGSRGRDAVRQEWNWESDRDRLLEAAVRTAGVRSS